MDMAKVPLKVLRGNNKSCVSLPDEELRSLVYEMQGEMNRNNGAGLAAPQIGRNYTLALVSVSTVTDLVLIDPRIESATRKTLIGEEYCLSFPGQTARGVERAKEVIVSYTDFADRGKRRIYRATGWLARVVQHEIDHLNGITLFRKRKNAQIHTT